MKTRVQAWLKVFSLRNSTGRAKHFIPHRETLPSPTSKTKDKGPEVSQGRTKKPLFGTLSFPFSPSHSLTQACTHTSVHTHTCKHTWQLIKHLLHIQVISTEATPERERTAGREIFLQSFLKLHIGC